MRSPFLKLWILSTALLSLVLVVPPARASVIGVGVGAFGAGTTLTTFNGLPAGLEVNGLTVDGILFTYSLGNGLVVLGGGPGVTNNITPLNIVSVGNNTGTLNLLFPSFLDSFGYGYALLSTAPVPSATTITLFNGATNVGSLSYPSVADPLFTGGFAGIQSTLPFDRAQVVFNSAVAPAFAMDNIRTRSVPEPSTVLLLGTGLGLLWSWRRTIKNRSQ